MASWISTLPTQGLGSSSRTEILDLLRSPCVTKIFRSLQDTESKDYDLAISVMQRSFFLALKYGGQAMSNTSSSKPRPGGSIVVTGSMAGVNGAVSDISYCKLRENTH